MSTDWSPDLLRRSFRYRQAERLAARAQYAAGHVTPRLVSWPVSGNPSEGLAAFLAAVAPGSADALAAYFTALAAAYATRASDRLRLSLAATARVV